MKQTVLMIIAVLTLVLVVSSISGCGSPQQTGDGAPTIASSQNSNSIAIINFAFSPPTLTINKGDTVVWTNQDSASHRILSDSGTEIDSVVLSTGATYTHTFNSAGTFDYHCSIHTSMKGRIVVQ